MLAEVPYSNKNTRFAERMESQNAHGQGPLGSHLAHPNHTQTDA